MKKILISAAMLTLAMSSCNKNEHLESSSPTAITFSTFIDRTVETKATITTIETITGAVVDAYKTGSESWDVLSGSSTFNSHMNDVALTIEGNKAGTSETYYWPTDGSNITFFSYSPVASDMEDTGSSISTTDATATTPYQITYTSATAVADQFDVVVSENYDLNIFSNNGTGVSVDLTYNHILSKVGIAVELVNNNSIQEAESTIKDTDETEASAPSELMTLTRSGDDAAGLAISSTTTTSVIINSVEITYAASTIKNSGVYTFQSDNSDYWDDLETSTFTAGTTTGAMLSGDYDVTSAIENYEESRIRDTDVASEMEEYEDENTVSAATRMIIQNNLTMLGEDTSSIVDDYLMLIPQTTVDGDLTATVKYTVSTTETTTDADSGDATESTTSVSYTKENISLPGQSFEAGKQYFYTLTIYYDGGFQIDFDTVGVESYDITSTDAQ